MILGKVYDGKLKKWAEQNINTIGYHYYMELRCLLNIVKKDSKIWNYKDYPDLRKMFFSKK